jgi:predicted RNA-binding protein with TRAM domain
MGTLSDARLCSGTFTDSNATIYTASASVGDYVIIKAVTLCNKTAINATVTLKFDGIEVVSGFTVLANDTVTIPFIDQVLEASEIIEGSSGTAASINYYISGVKYTA